MTIKTLKELRDLSDLELRKEVALMNEDLRDMRFRVASMEHKNPNELKILRRGVAQALTILRERGIAASVEPVTKSS